MEHDNSIVVIDGEEEDNNRDFCQCLIEPKGGKCTNKAENSELLTVFGERICSSCLKGNTMYELLTKKQVQDEYLLPDGSIQVLTFIEKENPRNVLWSSMKLYLRKHALALSLKRFGSEEAINMEKLRRKSSKYDKEVAKVNQMMSGGQPGE